MQKVHDPNHVLSHNHCHQPSRSSVSFKEKKQINKDLPVLWVFDFLDFFLLLLFQQSIVA